MPTDPYSTLYDPAATSGRQQAVPTDGAPHVTAGPGGYSGGTPTGDTAKIQYSVPPNFSWSSVFDNPSWSGQYTAPLTQGGLDALQGFNTMVGGVQPADINSLMQRVGGMANFTAPKTTVPQAELTGAFTSALGGPSFDTTEMFKNADIAFKSDLDKELARIKEEYSGYGLGPGSTDRNQRLATEAGTQMAKFNLGKLDIGRQSFENAQGRKIQTLGQAPAVTDMLSTPNREAMSEYSTIGQLMPYLASIAQLPFQLQQGKFDINNTARGIADTDIARRMNEFARTQGGGLNQLLAILQGTPLNNAMIGPSLLTQLAGLTGPAATAATAGK